MLGQGLEHRTHMDIRWALLFFLTTTHTSPGCKAEECQFNVKASRRTLRPAEGSDVSMHCDIIHCGRSDWIGGWKRTDIPLVFLEPTPRYQLYKKTLSANSTSLFLKILKSNMSDSGGYHCVVKWGNTSLIGHVTILNITAGVLVDTTRKWTVVAASLGSSVCILLIMVLACFVCPACHAPADKDITWTQRPEVERAAPETEVVYTSVLVDRVGRPARAGHRIEPPTEYSTLHFPMRLSHEWADEHGHRTVGGTSKALDFKSQSDSGRPKRQMKKQQV